MEWTIQYFQLQDNIKWANIGFRLERLGNYLFNFELGDKNKTLTTPKFILIHITENHSNILDLAQSRDQYKALFKQHQQSQDNIQLLQTDRDKLQEQIREIQKLSHGAGARSSSAPSDQAGPAAPVSPLSSSTQRALSPVAQVMEEPGPVPLPGGSSSSSPAPMAPPVEEPDHNQAMIDAAAALVRYPRVHQARPQQFVQPLQPARHQEEEQEEEEDDSFDVLNAPPQYQKQSGRILS